MTGTEFRTEMDFNENLTVGQTVIARWTNSFNAYATTAEVVKVNRQSLRVKLLADYGPYKAGHVIVLPKFTAQTWSMNNCAAPAPAEEKRTAKQQTELENHWRKYVDLRAESVAQVKYLRDVLHATEPRRERLITKAVRRYLRRKMAI